MVDTGRCLCGFSKQLVRCNDTRGERPGIQIAVQIVGKSPAKIKKCLLVFLAVTKSNNCLGTIVPVMGHPRVDAVAILVRVVPGCVGSLAIIA